MTRGAVFLALTCGVVGLPTSFADSSGPAASTHSASALYDRLCLPCHGEAGDGRGPATPWLWPRPRDFTSGDFRWRTTRIGSPPTDRDLMLAIRYGVPGTSMPGFDGVLDSEQIRILGDMIRGFSGDAARTPEPILIGEPPPIDDAHLARGKELFTSLGCVMCHGPGLGGDGPAAASLRDAQGMAWPPYDLSRLPLRRPRAPGESAVKAIFSSVLVGLRGTPMPSFAGVPEEDLWAVAAYVDTLRSKRPAFVNDTRVHPSAAAAAHMRPRLRAGRWPAEHPLEGQLFGQTIPLQGPRPGWTSPATGSLSARQCARCHPAQYQTWSASLHGKAASPGLLAQLLPLERGNKGAQLESCLRCHAPLAEQQILIRSGHAGGSDAATAYRLNSDYRPDLRSEGVNCASCHVRKWKRYGPKPAAGSRLLSLPEYPTQPLAIYERADFCLPCHQLPPSNGVNEKPLLNTYREWLEGPYMRRGIQCQHCHMPSRAHTWKGVHDPETFRQGIQLDVIAGRSQKTGAVSVRARLQNVGAGHYLPTTPTPAAWIEVELIDGKGRAIRGASSVKRIGRHLRFEDGHFVEVEDTRIPPGESAELAVAWKDGEVRRARSVRVTIRVSPDDYYEGLYRGRLRKKGLSVAERALFVEALKRAEDARYEALQVTRSIERR